MTYKAIGFDWGGVLNGKPGKFFGEDVAKLLGITHEQYKDAYFHHNKKINRGEVTWEQLWTLVLSELGQPDKVAQVMTLSDEANKDALNIEVLELVDTLRAQGYKVGLLSNNTQEKADSMRAKGLDKHFDVFHISAETGLVKPDIAAFEHLAQSLETDISELIFIDDTDKSLSTAKVCGFMPILFADYEQLTKALRKLGIET